MVVARNILNPKEHKLIGAKGIDKPADLRGKKVGMLVGSSTDWYSTKYLKAFDLEEGAGSDAVELVSIGAPEWIPALERGDIAAFFGWEPWVTKAQQIVDGAHVLHDGGEDGLFILMNCMVFNMDWIEKRSGVGRGDDARAHRDPRCRAGGSRRRGRARLHEDAHPGE